jgi:heat shock protein HslJ
MNRLLLVAMVTVLTLASACTGNPEAEETGSTPQETHDASPTPVEDPSLETDTARSLLGTWQLATWHRKPLPRSRGPLDGPVVTFEPDGTWHGSDGCNNVEGRYHLGPGTLFRAKTTSTTLKLCDSVYPFPVPARGATRVKVQNDVATFFDTEGQQVAKYRRPGGALAAEAKVVTRPDGAALALSTYGSGSCPTRMESISLDGDGQLMVHLADSPDTPCTADFRRSTDVMALPDGVDLSAPLTATLVGRQPRITLLIDTSVKLAEPLLVTAKDWDGTSTDQARLEGVLGVDDKGCVTVGETVVMWPNTYHLVTDRADTWAIATTDGRHGPGYMNVLAAEGESVVLAGGMTPFDVGPGSLPDATHSECLLDDDYWTGIIEVSAND